MLYHITDKDTWTGNKIVHQCSHPSLTEEQERKKKWLSPTSQAYIAAETIVLEKRLIKDFGKVDRILPHWTVRGIPFFVT